MRTAERLKRVALAIFATASIMVLAAVAPTVVAAQEVGKTMTTASGLQMTDTRIGDGASPMAGQICVVHYTGWLYENGAKGKKFDSSRDRGQPFAFPIGRGRVIFLRVRVGESEIQLRTQKRVIPVLGH